MTELTDEKLAERAEHARRQAAEAQAQLEQRAAQRQAEWDRREHEYDERVLAEADEDPAGRLSAETREAAVASVELLRTEPWFKALCRYAAVRHVAAVRQREVVAAAGRVLGQEEADRVFLPELREFSLVGVLQTALDEAVREVVRDAEAEMFDRRRAAVEGDES